ncbi:MAG: hypothetical protein JOZ82_07665, partial [Marmoricola sp.]|nr:hypothetical protein [Marmoricola sp.]
MDLSAVIFVVLALAWAGYLIPKALKHHDEMASDRLVEGHSDRVRILRRKTTATEVVEESISAPASVAAPALEGRRRGRSRTRAPQRELTPAGTAARRRRRVLAVLLVALVAVAALAGLAYLPWWSVAVPGVLVLAFLVVARFSVRS